MIVCLISEWINKYKSDSQSFSSHTRLVKSSTDTHTHTHSCNCRHTVGTQERSLETGNDSGRKRLFQRVERYHQIFVIVRKGREEKEDLESGAERGQQSTGHGFNKEKQEEAQRIKKLSKFPSFPRHISGTPGAVTRQLNWELLAVMHHKNFRKLRGKHAEAVLTGPIL